MYRTLHTTVRPVTHSCCSSAPALGRDGRRLGHAPQRASVEAHFPFDVVRDGRPYDAAASGMMSGLRDLTAVFADRGIGRDAVRLAGVHRSDVVIVGCLLPGAIDETIRVGLPVGSLAHTLWSFF